MFVSEHTRVKDSLGFGFRLRFRLGRWTGYKYSEGFSLSRMKAAWILDMASNFSAGQNNLTRCYMRLDTYDNKKICWCQFFTPPGHPSLIDSASEMFSWWTFEIFQRQRVSPCNAQVPNTSAFWPNLFFSHAYGLISLEKDIKSIME